ncbi:hypothetical protein LZ554_003635 [Drepanopeziza brunnea f. sp. 'monogermtubi']|nr:hypothetical protein LZ554_003635 [Drepanopeziza brunnea f. sp. 'monogermtubi']
MPMAPQDKKSFGTPPPEKIVVAFLGPIASYTHQATLGVFASDQYVCEPALTIEEVFIAVQSGKAACGVVPFENSTNGAVVNTFEIMADRHDNYADITVCGEAYLDVHHCLVGKKSDANYSPDLSGACTPTMSIPNPPKPRVTPLHSLKHVSTIVSHPQAFGQCDAFLNFYLKGVPRVDATSTSEAAKLVKEDESGASAAIASILTADLQDLDVLAKGIEDREDNTTRFLIIRKGVDAEAGSADRTKSLISFKVDHGTPGALASVLNCFQKHGINLTSINSRPTKVIPFQYIFFVEFEGSRLRDPNQMVKKTLDALESYVQSWRWLGSWDDKLLKR